MRRRDLQLRRKCLGDGLVATSKSTNEIASSVSGAPQSVSNRIRREVRQLDHEHVAHCRKSVSNVKPPR
jgi:hypothetical protein